MHYCIENVGAANTSGNYVCIIVILVSIITILKLIKELKF